MDNQDILFEPMYVTQHIQLGCFPESVVERVKQRAKDMCRVTKENLSPIFCEMLYLVDDNDRYHWMEFARWIKYQETVENVTHRWSKPHIPLMTASSLFKFKNCIRRGAVLLNTQVDSFHSLISLIVSEWEERLAASPGERSFLYRTLLRNKTHLNKASGQLRHNLSRLILKKSPSMSSYEAAMNEEMDHFSPEEEVQETTNTEQVKKYLEKSEGATILLAQLPDLKKTLSAFVTLQNPKQFPNLSEVSCPTKFLFILLVPEYHSMEELLAVGQCAGTLFSDPNFRLVAYFSQDVTEIVCGIDEFYRESILIPPGKWRCDIKLEPNELVQENEVEKKVPIMSSNIKIDLEGLQYTGRVFGGLIEDIKRRMPHYVSDFKDGFTSWRAFSQCMAAAFFLFFANLTNIIAFGGIMGNLLDDNMAVTECIIAAIISGCLFGLLAGQPLCIMSATGPVLMFEALFYEFCTERGWPFLPARFWLCFWATIILLILVAADASFLVAYITRFTEETFATLIAVVFIVESFEAMAEIAQSAPMIRNFQQTLKEPCLCNVSTNASIILFENQTTTQCRKLNGTMVGTQCSFKPDVFAFSIVLFGGGFLFSMWLDNFKDSRFFTNRFREMVSDFSLLLSIFIMTLISYFVAIPVPSLSVPTEFKATFDRSWIINPLNIKHWSEPLIIFFPALLLVVLIVMDQHVTTVMLNRKENQLRKGFGYHLDLLVVAMLTTVAGIMGIPLFLSATILSLTHMHVLRMNSKNTAPGDKPVFLGVREQRFSTVFAHILMGLCVLMAPIERHIPIPVLLGVFLYMGISCLVNIEFFQRILLFFTPMKNQPDFSYLRLVPVRRIHLFTICQIFGLVSLCVVNYVDVIELFFPLMLIALVAQRKLLEWWFTEKELCILDDPLPPWKMLKQSLGQPQDKSDYESKLIRNFGLSSKESYAL